MEKIQATLNLARRLRPQQFSQIIGQDLPVRMLKNSLYMNKFFPVYLLAGQRGCGKTSTARVFATAINCEALTAFQKNPTTEIPCLLCNSCLSMKQGAHPDFIEIDAASNTGVDNVRQLIETATYVPLQGKKKVYLIDEAHMLSKAAFNAFLKILEEPPVTVLFMLATTELHKIPQTVLSRCFQLFFPALEQSAFANYLKEICIQEAIEIEESALALIINESDGSARDALNLLEQVRFVESPITEKSIRKILGKLSIDVLLELIDAIVTNNAEGVINLLNRGAIQNANPTATWDLFVSSFKVILWIKYSAISIPAEFLQHKNKLLSIAQNCSHNRLLAIMQLLWNQESIFLQTSKKSAFLEFLCLQLAEQDNIANIDDLLQKISPESNHTVTTRKTLAMTKQAASEVVITPAQNVAEKNVATTPVKSQDNQLVQAINPEWTNFLTKLKAATNDALLLAILEQACHEKLEAKEIRLALRQNSKFFKEKLDEMKGVWLPILQEIFGTVESVLYTQQDPVISQSKPNPKATSHNPPTSVVTQPKSSSAQTAQISSSQPYKSFKSANQSKAPDLEGEFITPSASTNPFASLLLAHFPGKLKRLKNFS